jgi:hypothetical protein
MMLEHGLPMWSVESSLNDVIIINTHNEVIVAFQHGSYVAEIRNDLGSYDVICRLCWQIALLFSPTKHDGAILSPCLKLFNVVKPQETHVSL